MSSTIFLPLAVVAYGIHNASRIATAIGTVNGGPYRETGSIIASARDDLLALVCVAFFLGSAYMSSIVGSRAIDFDSASPVDNARYARSRVERLTICYCCPAGSA